MKKIQIPETDLALFPIGLGTVNAGGRWSDREAMRIFDAYYDYGGNVIDTARIYSGGKSEDTVGKWLVERVKRDHVIVMTKGGHPKYEKPGDDLHIPRMTPHDMREDLELSLRSLKTDYVDIYFYHRDNPHQTIEEVIEVMEFFRKEGKIRYYACSNWTAERIKKADDYCRDRGLRGFVADEALYNLAARYMNPLPDDTLVSLTGELYDYHLQNPQNLVMTYMSAAGGFFHKYEKGGVTAVGGNPYGTEKNIEIAEACIELARDRQISLTQAVLGFLFVQPFHCVALYGPRDSEQIIEAVKTADCHLTKNDYSFLSNTQ